MKKNAYRGFFAAASSDAGLTLVEVVAAVIVVVTVALASAGLSINGIQTAAAQERQQVAVTIANGALEDVSGWDPSVQSGATVSNLYTGRCQTAVTTAFANNSTIPGVSNTYPQWDPVATAAATCSAPSLPIVESPTGTGTSYIPAENGTNYTVTTLIGDCYEPVTGGACAKVTGQSTDPSTTPTGYSQVVRIIVIVSWTAGSTCATNGCYYEATTMEDSHADAKWVSS
jgi:Tfp pilus assembly protein PilV